MADQRQIAIHIPMLARVEGEGALDLEVRNGQIEDLRLRIFEPPRLFEKFLEGRSFREVPDAVARICGICPVAYQMSAVRAIESAFGIQPTPWVRAMRRVFYCGEWMESHGLHVHLLAVPDFLGYSSAMEMAKDYPAEVRRGLYLQGLGNDIVRLFGARSVHPVGARVGGFFHAPEVLRVAELRARLDAALPLAADLVRWVASLEFPDRARPFTCVSVRHPAEYPMNEGSIVSSAGLMLAPEDFDNHFREQQVPHSNALHCRLDGSPYLVGPLARLNLNVDKLPEPVRAVIDETPIVFPSYNMYHSIVARAVEILYCVYEAARLLRDYQVPTAPYVESAPVPGTGTGCTEAPRGMLWHRYELDVDGIVRSARIIPPTSQNQARIEEDLRLSLEEAGFEREDEQLRWQAETVIRNYDPCISCSTHFLDLRVKRL